MTPELDKYFQNYFEMFGTTGWKQLLVDLEDSISGPPFTSAVTAAKTERDLGVIQGMAQKARLLVNLQTSLEAAYAEAQEDYDE